VKNKRGDDEKEEKKRGRVRIMIYFCYLCNDEKENLPIDGSDPLSCCHSTREKKRMATAICH